VAEDTFTEEEEEEEAVAVTTDQENSTTTVAAAVAVEAVVTLPDMIEEERTTEVPIDMREEMIGIRTIAGDKHMECLPKHVSSHGNFHNHVLSKQLQPVCSDSIQFGGASKLVLVLDVTALPSLLYSIFSVLTLDWPLIRDIESMVSCSNIDVS